MHCSRCASDAGPATPTSSSALGLASAVAVAALVCPECGSPIEDGAWGTVIATMLAQLDRFGLTSRSAPLLQPRREDA
jgi:hypothetical protein